MKNIFAILYVFIIAASFVFFLLGFKSAERTNWPLKDALLIGKNLGYALAQKVDPEIPAYSPLGYDSQFFWALAQDPFLKDPDVLGALDTAGYRCQRILFPLLAWAIPSPPAALPVKLFLINCFLWIAVLAGLILLCRLYQVNPNWVAVAFVLNGGVWFSVFHPLSDLLATACLLWGVIFYERKNLRGTVLFWALATLARENAALVPGAFVLYHLSHGRVFTRENVAVSASILPAILWQWVLFLRFGNWPLAASSGNVSAPFYNLYLVFEKITAARDSQDIFLYLGQSGLGIAAKFLMLAKLYSPLLISAALVVLAFCILLRWNWRKNFFNAVIAIYALLVFFSGRAILETPLSSLRVPMLWLILLPIYFQKELLRGDGHFPPPRSVAWATLRTSGTAYRPRNRTRTS